MSIDWITVGAQIANFLVLVWLLRRYLYRPILDGIDAREAEIKDRMQEAARAKDKAEAVEQTFHEKTQALKLAQADLSETIRKTAEEQRDVLLADAQKRLSQEQAAWQAHLDDETRKYTARMHRAGAGALLELTRKAVSDLADESFETRMVGQLLRQVEALSPDLKRAAGEATEAVVTSHDPLATAVQKDLTAALRGLIPKIVTRFETSEEQSPGLVIQLGGAQLTWTVASYIDDLEALIGDRLASVAAPKGNAHGQ